MADPVTTLTFERPPHEDESFKTAELLLELLLVNGSGKLTTVTAGVGRGNVAN